MSDQYAVLNVGKAKVIKCDDKEHATDVCNTLKKHESQFVALKKYAGTDKFVIMDTMGEY